MWCKHLRNRKQSMYSYSLPVGHGSLNLIRLLCRKLQTSCCHSMGCNQTPGNNKRCRTTYKLWIGMWYHQITLDKNCTGTYNLFAMNWDGIRMSKDSGVTDRLNDKWSEGLEKHDWSFTHLLLNMRRKVVKLPGCVTCPLLIIGQVVISLPGKNTLLTPCCS